MTGRRKALQQMAAGGRFEEFWRQQRDATEWRIFAEQVSMIDRGYCGMPYS
jgi:hypothetical protein